jgi:hypothetical protein
LLNKGIFALLIAAAAAAAAAYHTGRAVQSI